jgi:NAD(P)-dependent dehydrogenase (short-subunit alcohol dehydrogenase family)
MQLKDKIAIVAGASLGIGQAIALAREGAAVAVNYAKDAEAGPAPSGPTSRNPKQSRRW